MASVTIGEMIRRKRKDLGLNQHDLGETFGVNQSSVAKWERGTKPAPAQLPALAKFLRVPLQELLSIYHDSPDASFEESLEEVRVTVASMDRRLSELTHLVQAAIQGRAPKSVDQNGAQDPPRRRRVVRAVR